MIDPGPATPLRVLLIEDSEDDAAQELRQLKQGGYEVAYKRVESESDMRAALDDATWDIVISDYRMPRFSGLAALAVLRERDTDLPFIVVSGTIGEETAVAMMKAGASDYVMKGNLTRLAAAVRRELRDAQTRIERRHASSALRDSEQRFRQLAETIRDVFFIQDVKSPRIHYVSPAYEEIWGRTTASLYANPLSWSDAIHPDDRAAAMEKSALGRSGIAENEYRIIRPDGTMRCIHVREFPVFDDAGAIYRTAGIATDVTARKCAEDKLRGSESQKAAILESSIDCVIVMDHMGEIVEFNAAAEATYGLTRIQALGRTVAEVLVPPRLRKAHDRGLAHYLATGEGPMLGKRLELQSVRADGSEFPVEITITPIGSKAKPLFTAFVHDITVRKAAEEKIKRLVRVHAVLSGINGLIARALTREELFADACRLMVEHGNFVLAWIGEVQPQGGVVVPVASAGNVGNFFESAPLGTDASLPGGDGPVGNAIRTVKPVVSHDLRMDPRFMRPAFAERGINSLAVMPLVAGGMAIGVIALYAAEGAFFDAQEMELLTGLSTDISFGLEHIQKAERIDHLAYYDQLTGLANRTLFLERVDQSLASAALTTRKIAVIAIDISRFNKVNDALGRAAGDEILRQVADRMRAASGDDSRLARINADRFAAVSLQAETGEQLARLVETRMIQVFEAPFQIGDRPVAVSAHMGIAVFPDDGRSAEALMRNSEAAAAKAKVVGEPYLFYSEAMNARIAEQLALEGRLREALAKEEFVLHYQPKVDVLTREVVGLEALIRWQSAGRLVPPMDFIPLLEEAGLILQVGEWAQAQAARDHRALASAGLAPPRIAVNVSAQQLRQRDFVAVVERAATDGGKLAGVDLELTESQLMSDIEGSIVKLAALRKLGVNIAIDDFGTGYSSLAHLAKLPVQSLKIDRSFIAAMDRDSGAKPLIIAIISLAHSLRLKVCAEGVETEAQAQFLALQDCDEMQGYLVSKPLPYEALLEFLRRDADHVRSRTDVATVQAERWSP